MSVSVDVTAAKMHFNNMIQILKNPRVPMNIIALKGVKDVVDHFDKSQGPEGKWAPLKPATIKRKGSDKPLLDKGLLRLSVRGLVSGSDAVIMSKTDYGIYHQEGTKHIPKRKFIYISDKAMQSMVATYLRYLLKDYGL